MMFNLLVSLKLFCSLYILWFTLLLYFCWLIVDHLLLLWLKMKKDEKSFLFSLICILHILCMRYASSLFPQPKSSAVGCWLFPQDSLLLVGLGLENYSKYNNLDNYELKIPGGKLITLQQMILSGGKMSGSLKNDKYWDIWTKNIIMWWLFIVK